MILIARCKKLNILGVKEHRKLLLIRGLFGFMGLLSLYFAVKLINPSDATALSNTKLIMLAILARLFLKEKFTTMHLFSLLFTIGGKYKRFQSHCEYGKTFLEQFIYRIKVATFYC